MPSELRRDVPRWSVRALRGAPRHLFSSFTVWVPLAVGVALFVRQVSTFQPADAVGALTGVLGGGVSVPAPTVVDDDVRIDPVADASEVMQLVVGTVESTPEPVRTLDPVMASCRVSFDICRFTRGELVVEGACPYDLPRCP